MRYLLSLLFFFPFLGSALTFQVINKDAEQIEEIITEILEIQKSLLLPLEISEIPLYLQTGFLTIQMTHQYLLDFIQTGKFLIAVHQNQIVAYLLLDQMEKYLNWADSNQFNSGVDLRSFQNIQYIDQIGVVPEFARQRIGTALIEQAKRLSPDGLLTDILSSPHCNHASLCFFAANGFLHIGTMQIKKTAKYQKHATSVMLWLSDFEVTLNNRS